MKKASKPTARKPALKAPAIKQSSKPKAAARPLPKAKPAKALVPATLSKSAAKPLDVGAGQAELAQVVARLSRTADKLAQAADRLAASAEKLGATAEATRQAAQRQDSAIAMVPEPPDFSEVPDEPQKPDDQD
jgi:hypothetical protein